MLLNIDMVTRGPKSYKVICSGKTYYASFKVLGIEQAQGKTVEAVVTANEYNGKTFNWIEAFEVKEKDRNADRTQPVDGGPVPRSLDRWYMPFVSNCCAHAIQSGYIQKPEDIKAWAKAAKQAAESLEDLFEMT